MSWEEWRKKWLARNGPVCDTCDEPCVWSEIWGWLHASPEEPFGMLPNPTDHEATAARWNAIPAPGRKF